MLICIPFLVVNFFDVKEINPIVGTYDLVVAVDCADASRVGRYISLFKENENSNYLTLTELGSDKMLCLRICQAQH